MVCQDPFQVGLAVWVLASRRAALVDVAVAISPAAVVLTDGVLLDHPQVVAIGAHQDVRGRELPGVVDGPAHIHRQPVVGIVCGERNQVGYLFPIDLVPVKAVLVSQCVQVVGTGLLLCGLVWVGRLTPWAIMLPVVWVLQIVFTTGLIWVLAAINVFFRDLQYVVAISTLILMMVSPIAYTPEMAQDSGLGSVLAINPLYYIILAYQDCLMLGRFPRGEIFWVLAGMSLVSFFLGHWVFSRVKRILQDNV